MKILIVSGFLGAGKTTFIQTMAKAVGRDFVVYENEYAGAGVDSGRLEEDDRISVFESLENCVCCSGKADFSAALLTISGSLDPEYLIVEPTGLARLSNLLANTAQVLYGNMELLAPVAIADAQAFALHRARYPDIHADQIRHAGCVLLSKCGGASPEELSALTREIRALNPTAKIITQDWTALDAAFFQEILSRRQDGTLPPPAPQGERDMPMDRMTLTGAALPTPTHLIAFLNALTWGDCGTIVRAKGCLPCGAEWLQFDAVEGRWALTGAQPQARSECVFIGPELRRNTIRRMLLEELYVTFPTKRKGIPMRRQGKGSA